jgi:hypothetical protein
VPRSSEWSSSYWFSYQNFVCISDVSHETYMHLIFLDLKIIIIFVENCKFETLHYAVFSFLLLPHVLTTMFSDALKIYSSLRVRDQGSHPYKTTRKILLIHMFSLCLMYISGFHPEDCNSNMHRYVMQRQCTGRLNPEN